MFEFGDKMLPYFQRYTGYLTADPALQFSNVELLVNKLISKFGVNSL
jgi:hypothetical protein